MSVTYIILGITVLISVMAFSNAELKYKFMFIPHVIQNQTKQHYRFISHILIHADWMHLIFNMYVLFIFGTIVEEMIVELNGDGGVLRYLLLYVGGAVFATLIPFIRNKENPNYMSLGASGAVSAVVFASIILAPQIKIGLVFLPAIPGYLFGILYIAFEYYMDKKGGSGVAHDAHLGGAVFGLAYVIATQFDAFQRFIQYISN